MIRSDEAFLLNKHRLGEADLILSLFGENTGLIRGVARSALKSRKRFGGTLEPLSRVRLHWAEKSGRDLHRIDAMDLLESNAAMQADPQVQACCALVSEIVLALGTVDYPDPKFFRLVQACLAAFREEIDPWVCIRYFEFWALRLHGVLPDLERCGICHNSIGATGVLAGDPYTAMLCLACGDAEVGETRSAGRETCRFLREAQRSAPAGLHAYGTTCRPGGRLEWFLRGSLERFAERRFRSYRHMTPVQA
jgi:DNA repair protein RecO (recombination protein O)